MAGATFITRSRLTALAPVAAVGALFALALSTISFVDPDLWHEMALFREAVTLGHLPDDDCFAYTPTISPSVHHEWGTGAVLYGVTAALGWGGLMALKYLLTLPWPWPVAAWPADAERGPRRSWR